MTKCQHIKDGITEIEDTNIDSTKFDENSTIWIKLDPTMPSLDNRKILSG